MRILFLHQNCPGQYRYLAPFLAAQKSNEVFFITRPGRPDLEGVRKVEYKPRRRPSPQTHHYIREFEGGILNGQAVAEVAITLRNRGFVPDIVCAHPGWGEALYIKDVYPDTPLLVFCEFYYHATGADVGFDPERKVTQDDLSRIRTRNSLQLLSLEGSDWGVSPTHWQRQQFPKDFLHRVSVIHDGINTVLARPEPDARLVLPDGNVLGRNDEVVTYVARNLEPYRGFPSFMRAVAQSCRRRPRTHYVIVGGDEVSYGRRPSDGRSWRQHLADEVSFDEARVHFLGSVPYATFLRVLQVSSAHVYLTYPFVLSWSMLEAMSSGCVVIGSDTEPVREVIEHGRNGLLVDFFSPGAIAERIDEVLDHRDRMSELGRDARRTILERYELKDCLRQNIALMDDLVAAPRRVAKPAGAPGSVPP
jgi:glycosyltransferase involved in cell wall biosynthesis